MYIRITQRLRAFMSLHRYLSMCFIVLILFRKRADECTLTSFTPLIQRCVTATCFGP